VPGSRDQAFVADLDLHHRQADGLALALGAGALFDVDVELGDVEIIRHLPHDASCQQLE
jgi:hypothetical protein